VDFRFSDQGHASTRNGPVPALASPAWVLEPGLRQGDAEK